MAEAAEAEVGFGVQKAAGSLGPLKGVGRELGLFRAAGLLAGVVFFGGGREAESCREVPLLVLIGDARLPLAPTSKVRAAGATMTTVLAVSGSSSRVLATPTSVAAAAWAGGASSTATARTRHTRGDSTCQRHKREVVRVRHASVSKAPSGPGERGEACASGGGVSVRAEGRRAVGSPVGARA